MSIFPLRPVPHRYPVTAEFGRQNVALWGPNGHRGVDFGPPNRTPVRAIADGIGRPAGSSSGLGDYAQVMHGPELARYCHMSQVYVKAGQSIRRGDIVGLSGNSGERKDGKPMPAHLHVELLGPDGKFRDPEPFGPLVVLDPGHGGSDGGHTGPGAVREADVVLFAAQDARTVLERAGFEVLMTRAADRAVSLAERVRLANAAKADLLLSLHCGGGPGDARGITAYRLPGGQAERIAERVREFALVFTGSPDLGARKPAARLAVLRDTRMAAVLFELGHITHPGEAALLREPSYRQSWAHAITAGLLAWMREVK